MRSAPDPSVQTSYPDAGPGCRKAHFGSGEAAPKHRIATHTELDTLLTKPEVLSTSWAVRYSKLELSVVQTADYTYGKLFRGTKGSATEGGSQLAGGIPECRWLAPYSAD